MSERRPVPRVGRVLDLVAVLVFAIGAGAYAVSWVGLRDIERYVRPADGDLFATVARAEELSRLGRVGLGLMIGALVIGIAAAVVARRAAPREA